MIIPSFRNEPGKALVEERLREAERERRARPARMRTRSNRTWVSRCLSRPSRWTRTRRSPQPDRAVIDDTRARADVAPPARVRAATAASRIVDPTNSLKARAGSPGRVQGAK